MKNITGLPIAEIDRILELDSELGLYLLVPPGSKPGPVENCEAFFAEPAAEVSHSAPSNVTYNPPLTELFTVVVDPAMPEGVWAMRPHRPGDDVPPCQVCLKRDADLAAGLSMMMGAGPARIARVVPWEKDPSCPSGVSERAEFDVNGGVLRMYARRSYTGDPQAPFCAHVVLGKDGEHGDDWHIRENIPAATIAEAKALAGKEARTALRRIMAQPPEVQEIAIRGLETCHEPHDPAAEVEAAVSTIASVAMQRSAEAAFWKTRYDDLRRALGVRHDVDHETLLASVDQVHEHRGIGYPDVSHWQQSCGRWSRFRMPDGVRIASAYETAHGGGQTNWYAGYPGGRSRGPEAGDAGRELADEALVRDRLLAPDRAFKASEKNGAEGAASP